MTLDRLRPAAEQALVPFVAAARRLGLTPNEISVIAFGAALAAAACFALAGRVPALYPAGAFLVFVNGWLDLVDGALARETGAESRTGDLVDHVLDRYADIALIAGLAGGTGRYALGVAAVTGVLMTSYMGTQIEAVGLDRVYAGLLGRADRLALVAAVTALAPFVEVTAAGVAPVGWLLITLAFVGHLTALQRFYGAVRTLP
ncbi:MAG: CDP-alcohol phosphatidyltransferase family protein [Salinirussus sp.]